MADKTYFPGVPLERPDHCSWLPVGAIGKLLDASAGVAPIATGRKETFAKLEPLGNINAEPSDLFIVPVTVAASYFRT